MKAKFIEKFLKKAGLPYRYRKGRNIFSVYPGEDREISVTPSDKTISLAGTEDSFETFSRFLASAGFPDIARKAEAFESAPEIRSYQRALKTAQDHLIFWCWVENLKYRKLINFILFRKRDFFKDVQGQYIARKKHYSNILRAFPFNKRKRTRPTDQKN